MFQEDRADATATDILNLVVGKQGLQDAHPLLVPNQPITQGIHLLSGYRHLFLGLPLELFARFLHIPRLHYYADFLEDIRQNLGPVHLVASRIVEVINVVDQVLLHLIHQIFNVQHHAGFNGYVIVANIRLVRIDVDIKPPLDRVDQVGVFHIPHLPVQLGHVLGNAHLFHRQGVQVLQQMGLVPRLLLQWRWQEPKHGAVDHGPFMGVAAGWAEGESAGGHISFLVLGFRF